MRRFLAALNATVAGHPALLIRKLVRGLNNRLNWDWATVQRILSVGPSEARDFLKALEAAGLAKANRGKGPKTWTTTQLAQSFGSATAAKRITRQTADAALAQLLERVDRVNSDDYFLAQVTCVCQLDLAPFDALIWPHLVFA